jgi:hypothetical protein
MPSERTVSSEPKPRDYYEMVSPRECYECNNMCFLVKVYPQYGSHSWECACGFVSVEYA